ncbi:hypothetical protein M6B38_172985 [Iris pallida]|uniref:Uncharacterized protein n=1 Tax=Iris pallida TaxID=29817 RepID=A0AAX6ET82_IRIPA|nr:hypothetical protein M6B38_172985 [Iris pallida]
MRQHAARGVCGISKAGAVSKGCTISEMMAVSSTRGFGIVAVSPGVSRSSRPIFGQ